MVRVGQVLFAMCVSCVAFACDSEAPADTPKEAPAPATGEALPADTFKVTPLKNGGWAARVEGVDPNALWKEGKLEGSGEERFSSMEFKWAELTGEAPAELVLIIQFEDRSGTMSVFDVRDPVSPQKLGAPVQLDRTEAWERRTQHPYSPNPMATDLNGDGVSELMLTGFEKGATTLRVFGVEGGKLVKRVDVETLGHVHVPFDHDGDGTLELAALTTADPSRVDLTTFDGLEIEVTLLDARTGAAHGSKVPVETWLPRFFTYAIVSEEVHGYPTTLAWATAAMKSRELLPYAPAVAYAGGLAQMKRAPRGMFDMHSPELYARALYWPLEGNEREALVELARSDGEGSALAFSMLFGAQGDALDRPAALELLREYAVAPKAFGFMNFVMGLSDEEHGALCGALRARVAEEGISDSDRDRLAMRAVDAQVDCASFALEIMEGPGVYPSLVIKNALNAFNPKLVENDAKQNRKRRPRSEDVESRGTRAVIGLLGHADAEVRGSAAHVLTWRDGGVDALRAALARESDEDARETMKAALARKTSK